MEVFCNQNYNASLQHRSCVSFTNCTQSQFIVSWTEGCCQPKPLQDLRILILFFIGTIGIVGVICNAVTLSTFFYLFICNKRIKLLYNQDFDSITQDPVFFFIFNLLTCDFLYCLIGLYFIWISHFYGYFPHSLEMCKYTAFARYCLGEFIIHWYYFIFIYL